MAALTLPCGHILCWMGVLSFAWVGGGQGGVSRIGTLLSRQCRVIWLIERVGSAPVRKRGLSAGKGRAE